MINYNCLMLLMTIHHWLMTTIWKSADRWCDCRLIDDDGRQLMMAMIINWLMMAMIDDYFSTTDIKRFDYRAMNTIIYYIQHRRAKRVSRKQPVFACRFLCCSEQAKPNVQPRLSAAYLLVEPLFLLLIIIVSSHAACILLDARAESRGSGILLSGLSIWKLIWWRSGRCDLLYALFGYFFFSFFVSSPATEREERDGRVSPLALLVLQLLRFLLLLLLLGYCFCFEYVRVELKKWCSIDKGVYLQ